VDFLASTASVLAARGLLDGKEVDNLRLVLSGIQGTPKARSASVLLEMIDQKAEFLAVLEAWFGPSGFGVNLMRHTLRPHLLEIRRQLATFGSALLKKAELLFNRPIVLFDGAVADTRTVYATPL